MMRTLLIGLGLLGERVVERIRDLAEREVASEGVDRGREIASLTVTTKRPWGDPASSIRQGIPSSESIILPLDEARAVLNHGSEIPWLSRVADLGSPEIGQRQLGRLALWVGSFQAAEIMKASVERLLSGARYPDEGFRSILICSLGDGLESGSLIDLADLLRRFGSSRQRVVCVILPEGARGRGDELANTFGALREICNLDTGFPLDPLEWNLLSGPNGPLWHKVHVFDHVENGGDRLSPTTEHVAQSILAGIGPWIGDGEHSRLHAGPLAGAESEDRLGTCEGFFCESREPRAGGPSSLVESSREVIDLGPQKRKACDDLFEIHLGKTINEASQLLISEIKDKIHIIKDSIGESKPPKAIELSESIKKLHDIAKIRRVQGRLVLAFDRSLLVQRSSWFDANVLIRRDALALLQDVEWMKIGLDVCREHWTITLSQGKDFLREDVEVEDGGPSLDDLLVNGELLWKTWVGFISGEDDRGDETAPGKEVVQPLRELPAKRKKRFARLRDLHENLEFRCGLLLETLDTRVFRESLKNELSLRAKEILIEEIEKAKSVAPGLTLNPKEPEIEEGGTGSEAGTSLWESFMERLSARRLNPFLPISMSSQGKSFVSVRVPESADLEDDRLAEHVRAAFGCACDVARYSGRRLWVYYEEMYRSPCDLRNLVAYREAYQGGSSENFHIDSRFFGNAGFRDLCGKLVASYASCGNPACSADISGHPRTQRVCPQCHRWILSRCGNPECSLNNLHTHPDHLALSCPACGGLNRAAWWVCYRHGKNGVLVSVEKERCPTCIHAHHEDRIRFPAERISYRSGFPRSIPCPRCLDLKAANPQYEPFMIPEALIPFFRDGVNGHDRVLLDKLAKDHKLGHGCLCPRCRTYLIPVDHRTWRPPEGSAAVPGSSPAPAGGAIVSELEKPAEEESSSEMPASPSTGLSPPGPSSPDGPGPSG